MEPARPARFHEGEIVVIKLSGYVVTVVSDTVDPDNGRRRYSLIWDRRISGKHIVQEHVHAYEDQLRYQTAEEARATELKQQHHERLLRQHSGWWDKD